MMDPSDDLFQLLGNATRRRMLDLLAEHGSLSVTELAAEFPNLVKSGISKHLMALRAAEFVISTREGRSQIYRINPQPFADALIPWLARYEAYWRSDGH
ncbi:MAG: ArsR/SmtB family transcription factor [Thermomicrobiales bacterium]